MSHHGHERQSFCRIKLLKVNNLDSTLCISCSPPPTRCPRDDTFPPVLDKLPDEDNPQEMKLYPKQGEFRLTSPQLLLVDGRVASEGGGDGQSMSLKDEYFAYYAPHDGHYIFAFTEFPGATEGSIHGNQIDFTLDGRKYNLIAAAPIVNPDVTRVWVRASRREPAG